MICTLVLSKDISKAPITKDDNHHPSVESPLKAGPEHMAAFEAKMGPPAFP